MTLNSSKRLIPLLAKSALAFLIFTQSAHASFCQSLDMKWAKGLYSSKTSFTSLTIENIEVDQVGNTYIAGLFQGSIDLDPGQGETIVKSDKEGFGHTASFVAKYDNQGKYLFGFKLEATIEVLIVSSSNELVVVGYIDTLTDFDPSSGKAELDGRTDKLFVAFYNENGGYKNSFSTGTGTRVGVYAAALDSRDNLYLFGTFTVQVDLDPSAQKDILSTSNSGGAAFLAKYNQQNELIFAFSIDSKTANGPLDLAIDKQDQIFIVGPFSTRSANEILDLDPGPGNTNLRSFRGIDGYLAKYNSDGQFLNGYLIDGTITRIRLDSAANLYITGTCPDSMDMDFSANESMIHSDEGGFDIYLAKYNAQFELVQARTLGARTNRFRMEDMEVDASENVYITGEFQDTINLFKGQSEGTLIASGLRDAFIASFDKKGDHRYSYTFGTEKTEEFTSLDLDQKGNLYLSGRFTDSVNINPKDAKFRLTNPSDGGAAFFAKYNDPGAVGISSPRAGFGTISMRAQDQKLLIDLGQITDKDSEVIIIDVNGKLIYHAESLRNELHAIDINRLPRNQVIIVLARNKELRLAQRWAFHE